MKTIRFYFTLISFFVQSNYLMAAPASPLPSNELVPDDFLSLADLRGRLTGEISTLSKEIEQISDFDLRYAEEDQARLKDMETSINQRKAVTALTEEEAQRLRMDESEYEYRKSRSQDPTKLMAKLEEKRRQLDQKQAYSNQIQAKILKMLSPEQERAEGVRPWFMDYFRPIRIL